MIWKIEKEIRDLNGFVEVPLISLLQISENSILPFLN